MKWATRFRKGYLTRRKAVLSALCVSLMVALAAMAQYGVPTDGHPIYRERASLVLMNACRADPVAYRDAYIGSYSILTTYPAQNPLYWSHDLAVCARTHATDMATTCALMHNSCDGTAWNTRIRTCYACRPSDSIAENLACGTREPLETVNSLLLDAKSGGVIPADHTGMTGDSHRANIMAGSLREVGVGVADGPMRCDSVRTTQSWRYWAQDFGAKRPTVANRIASGAHLFLVNGSTTFMANYLDSTGNGPRSAAVVIDGQEHALARVLGTAGRGAYSVSVASAASCRAYYFTFVDNQGATSRYPESGTLVTYGEGNCATDYQAGTAFRPLSRQARILTDAHPRRVVWRAREIRVVLRTDRIGQTDVVDLRGRPVCPDPAGASGARAVQTAAP